MDGQTLDWSMDQRVARLQNGLSSLVQVLINGLRDRLSDHEVDAVGYTVLNTCLAEGPISARDLMKLVPIDPGHMSRTTSQLEDKGLLRKTRLRGDRRLVTLRVTEEGASLMPELTRRVQAYYTLLLRGISHEELVGCMTVMEKMIGTAGEGDASPTPAGAQGQSIESHVARLQGGVTMLVNVMFRGIEERVSSFGIAVGEYWVFAACFANEPITVSDLAEHVPIGVGRVSRIVSKLEDMQLVRKVRLKEDRRVVRVRMTDQGRDLALELMGRVGEHYANVMGRVSEQELAGLMEFVERMTENAKVGGGGGGGDFTLHRIQRDRFNSVGAVRDPPLRRLGVLYGTLSRFCLDPDLETFAKSNAARCPFSPGGDLAQPSFRRKPESRGFDLAHPEPVEGPERG